MSNHASRVVSKLQFQGFQRFEPSKVAGFEAKLAILG